MVADIKLGARVRDLRKAAGISQSELGAILGVSFQQIQKYEKGTNRINANRLNLIASSLKMRPEQFYESDELAPKVSSLIDVTNASTLRMLRAYSRIKSQAMQRELIAFIETVAKAYSK